MSEQVSQVSEERMAIPEGGVHEEMDVSQDQDDGMGYVSIKAKGPGRPITIRSDRKDRQSLSQNVTTITSRLQDVKSTYFKGNSLHMQPEGTEDFLDKKTDIRHSISFDSVPPETTDVSDLSKEEASDLEKNVDGGSIKICSKLGENTETVAQLVSGFDSQSEVVSICPKYSLEQPTVVGSPAKQKYKLCKEAGKKTIGLKKANTGKVDGGLRCIQRQAPYPKWWDIPFKDIFKQRYVNIDGKKHLVQINLVPVENDSNSTMYPADNGEDMESDPVEVGDIISEGSIDRPPDVSQKLRNDYSQSTAVNQVAGIQPATHFQYNIGNHLCKPSTHALEEKSSAPNVYGDFYDKPLDLTIEKPLNLSMKEYTGRHILQRRNEEAINHEDLMASASIIDCPQSNTTEYRERCPSVASVYGSGQGEEAFETDVTLVQGQNYTKQNNLYSGNLPSLSNLTLECKESTSQESAVQVTAEREEIAGSGPCVEKTLSGQRHILHLLNSGKVTLQQLVQLHQQNQERKSANISLSAPNTSHMKTEMKHSVQPRQLDTDVPQADDVDATKDIPQLAMPNLLSLELANNDGALYETENERLKNNLKNKIKQRRNEENVF